MASSLSTTYGDATPGINLYTGPADTRKGYPIVGAEWAHTFSPTLLNSFRYGYSHQQPYEGQSATATSNLAATEFGVNYVNPDAFALAIPGYLPLRVLRYRRAIVAAKRCHGYQLAA